MAKNDCHSPTSSSTTTPAPTQLNIWVRHSNHQIKTQPTTTTTTKSIYMNERKQSNTQKTKSENVIYYEQLLKLDWLHKIYQKNNRIVSLHEVFFQKSQLLMDEDLSLSRLRMFAPTSNCPRLHMAINTIVNLDQFTDFQQGLYH